MAEQEAIGLLEQLARDFNVRDPRKLFQIARREFPDRRDLTSARAAAALRGDVARQILAPKPRSLGKSAAEGPNDRLQADLVDFFQNTRGRNKYGLVVQDVFTREIATKALPDKRAETVTRAAAEIIPDLVQEEGNYVVTTDLGNEFQGLEAALPGGAVHRQKDPSDRNANGGRGPGDSDAEEGPGGHGGPEGGRLGRARGRGGGGLQRPAAPGGDGGAGGRGNEAGGDLSGLPGQRREVPTQQAPHGGPAAAPPGGRGLPRSHQRGAFLPAPVRAREGPGIFRLHGRGTDGSETLLKHALPVPRGSAEPVARLTRQPVPLAVRQLRDFNRAPQPRLLT